MFASTPRTCKPLITLLIALAAFLVMPVQAAPGPELLEKKAFMEKAIAQQWEQDAAIVRNMAESGVFASMEVSMLRPFADWDFYFVDGSRIFWSPNQGQQFQAVEVPVGFVTDLTSIPRLFWQVLRPEGRYAYAAVVHDYLYWKQDRPRKEADQILKFAMEDSKVDPATVNRIYKAVRLFGQAAWKANGRLKQAGERRLLRQTPGDFTVTWREWKKRPGVFADE